MEDTPAIPLKIECHSERCPVCKGHTTVNYGKQTCKACQGKGYILVPNSIEEDRRRNDKSRNVTSPADRT